jgi:hypothetical protein
MYAQLVDSDMVILNSLDSYLRTIGMPNNITPDQMLVLKEQARYQLYSDIVQRVPRVAAYIMHANLDTDEKAQGLFKSLSNHCLDPKFIDLLMQQLYKVNSPSDNGVTGAFLSKVVATYLDKHVNNEPEIGVETKAKKGEKPVAEKKETKNLGEEIRHVYDAAATLLKGIADSIIAKCGNLDNNEDSQGRNPMALGIAACIAMNNGDAITEIIASDAPVTADIFDILKDPSNIIKGALLLDKGKFMKLTKNQEKFVDSLRRWVYKKLNDLPTQQIYTYLVSVYGTMKPDKETYYNYLIQLKDCGTQYSNLLIVAKQMFNQ